jgi:hypothetical protein
MDYQLLALIALIVAVVIAATRQHSRSWRGRRGWQYQRVFSVGFAGLLFFLSGVVDWDLSYSHGWFHGTKSVDGPVWWQIGLGGGLLMLAVFWARRVPMPRAVR